jgi:ribonuclease HI
MKGQVVADFIVKYRIGGTHELDISYLIISSWILYFDRSVCNEGQVIGIVLVSPRNASFDFSSRLKTYCTNNQAKYEVLLFGLELLDYIGMKHVKVFGDFQLFVQQILEEYQCIDYTLNSYLENCWDIIHSFDKFYIRHILRAKNCRANSLAQDASGYRIKLGKIHNSKSSITGVAPSSQDVDRPGYIAGPSAVGSDRPGKESGLSDSTIDVYLINLADNTADAID